MENKEEVRGIFVMSDGEDIEIRGLYKGGVYNVNGEECRFVGGPLLQSIDNIGRLIRALPDCNSCLVRIEEGCKSCNIKNRKKVEAL